MQLLIIIIFLCSFIFLYTLHFLAEDDFVVLRKNITTENIFNVAIGMGIVGLFFARLFFVLFNPKPVFFEILGFILFPYFPGLSLVGGFLGGLIFYSVLARKLGYPLERVFDFFAKSFLACAPFGILGIIALSLKITPMFLFNFVFYLVLFIIAIIFTKRGEKWLRDGSFGLLSLIFILIAWIVSSFFGTHPQFQILIYKENPIALLLIAVCLVLLVRNEAPRLRRNGS